MWELTPAARRALLKLAITLPIVLIAAVYFVRVLSEFYAAGPLFGD
jgi:hypothetical protein